MKRAGIANNKKYSEGNLEFRESIVATTLSNVVTEFVSNTLVNQYEWAKLLKARVTSGEANLIISSKLYCSKRYITNSGASKNVFVGTQSDPKRRNKVCEKLL